MTKSKLLLSLFLAGAVGVTSAQSMKDAKVALDAEQYDKAKDILTNLINKKPKDGEAYFYLGTIHLINDKVDSAAIVFNEGLVNSPKEKLNTIGLGIVDLQNSDPSAAEQKFTEGTSNLKRREYLPLYFTGKAYVEAPDPDYTKALEYLTQAKEKNAKEAEILVAIGDAYVGLGEHSPAYVSYRDALNIDPNLVKAKVAQAVITRRAQAYDVALEQLHGLTEEYPDYAPVYRELAETYYLSSLKMEHEEYRETNRKAVELYQKYLTMTGDNSVEAKTRYADFLVYSGNYEELKTVSEELANAEGVDAKVYRYLGYIAYNDKDYSKSAEYLGRLFDEVQSERLISRDYFFAGLANMSSGNEDKGVELLKQAIENEEEDDDFVAEISETAFAKYQEDEVDVAMKLFSIPAAMPESDYYYDSNYYIALGEYGKGSRILNSADEEEGESKAPEAKPHFEQAVQSLELIIAATKKDVVDKYYVPALYYKGLSELGMDNIHEPELMQGLFVDSFTKLIEALKGKPEEGVNVGYLTDANNYLGYFSYAKGDNEKAKAFFEKSLALTPGDEFASSFLEIL